MPKDTKNEIVVYQPDEQVRLDVCLANDTVWLSILQMSVLFGRERSVIAKHLKAAIDEGELDAAIIVQNLHNNQKGRPQAFYDLDAIISVGYRVKSLRGGSRGGRGGRRDENSSEAMSEPQNQIVVYQPDKTVRLEVRLENETVWLTQAQMATLFGCSTDNVGLHLKNIYACGELDRNSTAEESSVVQVEGRRKVSRRVSFYNLDAIISVGYRVNSVLGVKFRQWATRILKDYLLHGQALNQRLALLEDKMDRRLSRTESDVAELKDKVDFFVQTKEPPLQEVFYQNKFWDAKSLLIKLIRRAKKDLIVIDAYPGVATLDMLAKRARGVSVELVTHSNVELEESDFEAFGAQCGRFTKTICGICHDRFIIADQKEIFGSSGVC